MTVYRILPLYVCFAKACKKKKKKCCIDTDCSFSVVDKDGCGQRVLWTAHKEKGKKKFKVLRVLIKHSMHSEFICRLAFISWRPGIYEHFSHFPKIIWVLKGKLKLLPWVCVCVPWINKLLSFPISAAHSYLYVVWFSVLSSHMNLLLVSAANTLILHEVTERQDGGSTAETGAPEKRLCAAFEGAKALACQRLWL